MNCPKCGNECKQDADVDYLYLCETKGCVDYWTLWQQRLIEDLKHRLEVIHEATADDNWKFWVEGALNKIKPGN